MIGTGVAYNDISVGALETCKKCKIFAEGYTSLLNDVKFNYLSKTIGKKITYLNRSDLEENAGRLLNLAKREEIALLVGGDPLIATTHKILFIEALKIGVNVKIWHSSSIVSTVFGECGLDFYRFGKICTIPKFSMHYKPLSFYDSLHTNHINNLHSLILLDYNQKDLSTLSIKEALGNILQAESAYKKGVLDLSSNIIILKNLGLEDEQKLFTTIGEALKLDFGGVITLVLPNKLTKIERETIDAMYKK